MNFTGPELDRLAIRELYDTCADGGCRGDREAWLGCYAHDARWVSPYFDVEGIDAIGETYDAIMAGVVDTTIFPQIGMIEVEGDWARVRLQQAESLLYPDGSTYDLVGLYEDDLVRRDGRWWFLSRVYRVKRESLPARGTRFAGALADRIAVRELHDTYADAASRIDKAQWLDCWTDDAVWDTSTGPVIGKAALCARWDELFASMDAMAFFSVPGRIAVDGDTAQASAHFREIARIKGTVMKFAARYDDELVRQGGRWKFARRRYVMNIAE